MTKEIRLYIEGGWFKATRSGLRQAFRTFLRELDDRAKRRGVRLSPALFRDRVRAFDAFRLALQDHAVFQDDVKLTRNLRAWLETVGLWPSPRVAVLSLYTAAVNHRERPGWHRCEDLPRRAHGALAYVFPPHAARDFLAKPPPSNTWGQQDYWVGRWCRDAGLEYWMHSPSFVRHVGEVSTIQTLALDEYRQCREFLEQIDAPETHHER